MRHFWWFLKYCVLECAMLKILIIQIRQHRRSVPYLCIGLFMPCDFHTFHDFCNILALVTFSFRPFLLRISTCKNTKGIWLLRLRLAQHAGSLRSQIGWSFMEFLDSIIIKDCSSSRRRIAEVSKSSSISFIAEWENRVSLMLFGH